MGALGYKNSMPPGKSAIISEVTRSLMRWDIGLDFARSSVLLLAKPVKQYPCC
jgi:hypothetical protein